MPSHADRPRGPAPPGGGRLAIVGIGPGGPDQMTARARDVIAGADCVVGNGVYLDQVAPLLQGKEILRSSMGKEVERAQRAVELACSRSVAVVSGGDPGVYGMASIVLEVLERSGLDVPVEVVPGVTAATAAASRLGAPLSGDFVVMSLSDLLTPRAEIERRLDLAFRMGVPVVLYNPRSRGRKDHLSAALALAARHLPQETPVGFVKDAYRKGEQMAVTTLGEAREGIGEVDMHATVIIGGRESRIWRRGKDAKGIITPRGYERKYLY
ncbi:MAG TPA: precorrin-3B C(17)-methyltransferase [Methanomicrobiales archaeon]|nr:precorrin-3B C(17)-methyltransferase [Methanomicrobiales archaeon]